MNQPVGPRSARVASYRIQLTPDFGFADTIDLLDHLVSLGVSHVYLSPIAEAVPGSSHGYDVVDHTSVRQEFGGDDGLNALLDSAADHRLGVVIDHVPNHMSVAHAHLNDRWWTLLRDGPSSPAARWFDVDWAGGDGRIIVPKLGAQLDDLLGDGSLDVASGDLGPEIRYGPLRFPLAPGTEDLDLRSALEQQHYRLAWWRDPQRNVRRFFTIDDLATVNAHDPEIAEIIDTIPVRLTGHPAFAGVRVDHVDGLADPGAYLTGLRRRIGDEAWLLVEKILAPDELLPDNWPVDGTTGYEHIRSAEHTFLDPAAEQPLTDLWNEATDDLRTFDEYEDEGRRQVLADGLRPDLERLVRAVSSSISVDDDRLPRGPLQDRAALLRGAIVELTIGLHRYRTYLPDDPMSDRQLDLAQTRAVAARPDLDAVVAVFVEMIHHLPDVRVLWQRLTSPVMAKGAEDRAFYRYLRLASLCEVGGAPGAFAIDADDFHRRQQLVQTSMPQTLIAGTTHDTKRSEGVRARSLALAEYAEEWSTTARRHVDLHDGGGIDAATLLLALQTVVTAWPIDAGRLTAYLVKSAREADLYTTWIDPDERYESLLADLAGALVDETAAGLGDGHPPDHSLAAMVAAIERPGRSNSVALTAVRLTSPGVPDLYQGTSAFTNTLVDPDNRVEPDWAARRRLVERAKASDGPAAWTKSPVGLRIDAIGSEQDEIAKAVVIERTLALRRRRPDPFGPNARYSPIACNGRHAHRLLSFVRSADDVAQVLTLVVRRSVGVEAWDDTTIELPAGTWRNILHDDAQVVAGGHPVGVGRWLDHFPVAVLERTDA